MSKRTIANSVGAVALMVAMTSAGAMSPAFANNQGEPADAPRVVPIILNGATLSSQPQTVSSPTVAATPSYAPTSLSTNSGYGLATPSVAVSSATQIGLTNQAAYAAVSSAQPAQLTPEQQQRMRQLEEENRRLRERNQLLQQTSTSGGAPGGGAAADLPPNAKKGECYARVLIPAQYETLTEQVLDREAAERIEIIPAEYTYEEQTVLTREASERIEVIPATYKTVTETIEVEPARTELKTIPARYENVTERVLVREAYTTWKKGTGPITRVDEATGEIMCLVEVPAEYKTVVRKELKTPARTEEVFVPAKTRQVTKRVLDQQATTRTIPVPAQYDTVRVRKLVRPAQERRVPIQATYNTVTKQRKITDERLEWREILCETNTTRDVIRRVQVALRQAGYNPGGADGVLGVQTMRALQSYQQSNGLPSGQLTMATIRRLGVL